MYEVLDLLLKEFGVKPYEISKKTGISSSVFSDWKNGRYTPKIDKLEKIASFFGLPVSVFFEPTDKVRSILENKKEAERLRSERKELEKEIHRVAAGQGCYNDSYADETIKIEDSDDSYEYIRIVGDSMYPILMDGDIAVVEITTETTPRDLTVIKINGDEAMVKYLEVVSDGILLKAENKSVFEDKHYSVSDVLNLPISVIGRVIEVRRRFK